MIWFDLIFAVSKVYIILSSFYSSFYWYLQMHTNVLIHHHFKEMYALSLSLSAWVCVYVGRSLNSIWLVLFCYGTLCSRIAQIERIALYFNAIDGTSLSFRKHFLGLIATYSKLTSISKKGKKTLIILVDSVDNSCCLGRCACSACVVCCVLATNSNWDEKKWKKMKENEKTKHNKMKGMKRSNGGFRNTRAGEVGERADGFHCLLSVAWQISLSTWNLFIAHWTCSSKSESTLAGTLARTKF